MGRAGRSRFVAQAWVILAVVVGVTSVAPLVGAAAAAVSPGTATDEIEVVAEADDAADVLLVLPADAAIEIDGKAEEGYYPVVIGDLEGWVPTGALASVVDRPDDDHRDGLEIVAAADLPLRAEPDADADRLLGVAEGERVEPTGDHADGFVEVRVDDETGWVRGEDLTATAAGPSADAPTVGEDRDRREKDRKPGAGQRKRSAKPERAERGGRSGSGGQRVPDRKKIPEPPRNAPNYSRGELVRMIEEAADYYDQPREDMLRVARCESELTPTAVNPRTGDSGLFQFNPDTWQTTPYRRSDIFDPRASAYAAGWMWSVGRRNEWVCQ